MPYVYDYKKNGGRIKLKIVVNEKNYAEDALKYGKKDKHPSSTLRIIIRYLFNKGMSVDQIKQSLNEFMKISYKDYNLIYWQSKFESLIFQEKRNKCEMLNIETIQVTKEELRTISSLQNGKLERLAFVLLIYSKIYNIKNKNNTYWVNSDTKDVFSDCKLMLTKHKQELIIHELYNLGMIESSRKVDCTNIKVKYANDNGESEITITDFREVVYYYLRWKGDNIGECSECKKLYRISSNNHRMCRECWKEYRREYKSQKQREYRKYENVDTLKKSKTLDT